MNKYSVEFTDTFGGEANYCWINRYTVIARDMKHAITKAKQERYYAPIPKHTTVFNDGESCRIDIVGECVCAFITFCDADEAS
jgi:hypothetical protein